MEREQIVVAAKLSVAAGLRRAPPMRWEFTWIGGLCEGRREKRLQRKRWRRKALNCLGVPFFLRGKV